MDTAEHKFWCGQYTEFSLKINDLPLGSKSYEAYAKFLEVMREEFHCLMENECGLCYPDYYEEYNESAK